MIVGPVSPPGWLRPIVDELDLRESVTITGAVPFDDFLSYIAASDVRSNLRYPTAGESSASLLRVMGAARPVIVSDVGSFSELPDDCVVKVSVNSEEENSLFDAMELLASDAGLRRDLGQRALEYVLENHLPEKTAPAYIRAIEGMIRRPERYRGPGQGHLVSGDVGRALPRPVSDTIVHEELKRNVNAALSELGLV